MPRSPSPDDARLDAVSDQNGQMPKQRSTRFPETDEELEALREEVRRNHAAYMAKWEGWKPGDPPR